MASLSFLYPIGDRIPSYFDKILRYGFSVTQPGDYRHCLANIANNDTYTDLIRKVQEVALRFKLQ